MPAELEQQLPRLAEALDREAPAISVDEILGRPAVAVDVHDLERPSSYGTRRVNGVPWGDARATDGEIGERDTSMTVGPTVDRPPTRRLVLKVALAAAAVAVLVVALASVVRFDDEADPAVVPPSTLLDPSPTPQPTPPSTAAESPFVGVWLSIDTDGSSQTMEIARSGTDQYEVVIRDQAATAACAGGASTLAGIARLATDASLMIARPELTCDDGTIPPLGPPPQEELENFTLELDTATGQLVDVFGVVWQRDGADLDVVTPATDPTPKPPSTDAMWPQSTLEEIRVAQERADAGDPAYAWQLGARLLDETEQFPYPRVELQLIDRFLRERLGWEAYMLLESGRFSHWQGASDGWVEGAVTGQRYLRCAPGRTNPLYPPGPEPEPGELCAPTIDDLDYESVSLDIAQLDRQGRDGIWVVSRWELTPPFAQTHPAAVEAQAMERLEEFLTARIAGTGAEGLVEILDEFEVPLLYATTTGAPYERYEIERVDGPRWPGDIGGITFAVRLFADDDATVVEQEFFWAAGLRMDDDATTENGQPVVLSYTSSDGALTVSAPGTWSTWLPGKGAGEGGHEQALDVWFGALWRAENFFGSGERIELVDPVAYDAWCASNGGSPLLSAPADAAGIAQQVVADPDFETTTPVTARIGGVDAVSIDVTLAPGGTPCGVGMIEISRWIHGLWEPGWRLRLFLVDLPDGMPFETLAITVVAPEERFDDVIAETAPIIESIEFHPG